MSVIPRKAKVWSELLGIFEFLCRKHFNDAELDAKEKHMREVMSNFQKDVPLIIMAIVFHLVMHCFETARKWGSMREYWM